MGNSITLHPEKGVNPKITICINCGKDNGVALVGINDKVIECSCGTQNVCAKFGDKCPNCGSRLSSANKWRVLGDNEKIQSGLCDECRDELTKFEAIVKEGGVHWKCSDCGSHGVIKRCDYSLKVKEQMGLGEDAPCGVLFDKTECPNCTRDE